MHPDSFFLSRLFPEWRRGGRVDDEQRRAYHWRRGQGPEDRGAVDGQAAEEHLRCKGKEEQTKARGPSKWSVCGWIPKIQ